MSTESKIFTGVLASVFTGLLVSLHIVDPGQADTFSGILQTGFGLLISLVAIGYGLETLLVTHKSEVANTKYDEPPATDTTVTPEAVPPATPVV